MEACQLPGARHLCSNDNRPLGGGALEFCEPCLISCTPNEPDEEADIRCFFLLFCNSAALMALKVTKFQFCLCQKTRSVEKSLATASNKVGCIQGGSEKVGPTGR